LTTFEASFGIERQSATGLAFSTVCQFSVLPDSLFVQPQVAVSRDRALLMWEQTTTLQTFYAHRRASDEGLGGGCPVAASGLLRLDLPVEGDETATACFEQQQQLTPHSAQPSRVQTASPLHPELVPVSDDTFVAAILQQEALCSRAEAALFTGARRRPCRPPTRVPSPGDTTPGDTTRATTSYVTTCSLPTPRPRHVEVGRNGNSRRRFSEKERVL
jgi:hypothetical protein